MPLKVVYDPQELPDHMAFKNGGRRVSISCCFFISKSILASVLSFRCSVPLRKVFAMISGGKNNYLWLDDA